MPVSNRYVVKMKVYPLRGIGLLKDSACTDVGLLAEDGPAGVKGGESEGRGGWKDGYERSRVQSTLEEKFVGF